HVTRYQMMSDVMISDTSSSVYEFLLLDRPVVTFRTIARDVYWENIDDTSMLTEAFDRALNDPDAKIRRRWVMENYDPHLDGECCRRMIDEAQDYIKRHGVPSGRNLNLWRKYTGIKTFGMIKKNGR
ncbi:MAG: CDP-glycerol glycerophosphotransferase family protein, partial [Bacteroidaceae bacterium]|nr:CDP-glycerol glycerophosphotransferase family protein [Bacteroidaceae bacterium]